MQALLILAPGYGCAAGLADTMETCRHESDLNLRVTACAEVIGLSRDRRVLLRAHNTKGLALCDLDRCADAIPDFDEVIRLNPLIAGYFDNRARALRAAGRFDEAIRSSDHALRMAPGYAFIYFGKALALEGEKRFDEALTVLDQASSVDPTNAGVWELRGKLFGEEGQFARAYAAYDRALELQPSRVNVLRTRAGTEESEGKIQAAITDLRRYPADGPNHNDVSTQIFRLSNLPNGMKVELTHNRQDVQSLAQSSSDQNKNLDCVSIASSSERLKCFDEKYKDFSSAATNASPAPPINEGPQITKAPPMETGNYAEYCKNQITKRGVLDESLYKYCFRQQTDGNEKIASLLAKYPNYTWLKDVMEAEISAYTKRGMRNDDMIAFLMSQEIDAFLDFDYTSKQKDFNAMAAAQCKEEYYNKRPDWQMILYCYKEKIGAD